MLTGLAQSQMSHEVPHLVPLLDHAHPLLRDRIAVDVPSRTSWEGHGGAVDTALPCILLIRDDDPQTGPDGWACIIPLLQAWVQGGGMVLINPAPGRSENYERAVELARKCRRLILIDCWEEVVMQWHGVFVGEVSTTVLERFRWPSPQPDTQALDQLALALPGIEVLTELAKRRRLALDVPGRDAIACIAREHDIYARAHIVLLRDRDPSTGPSGWNCIRSLLTWGKSVLINPAPEVAYADAAGLAYCTRRLVLIDAVPAAVPLWRAALWPTLTTVIGETAKERAAYREARLPDRFSRAMH
jgi:hypothetical protein